MRRACETETSGANKDWFFIISCSVTVLNDWFYFICVNLTGEGRTFAVLPYKYGEIRKRNRLNEIDKQIACISGKD